MNSLIENWHNHRNQSLTDGNFLLCYERTYVHAVELVEPVVIKTYVCTIIEVFIQAF
jgi:hypothetical protein